MGATKKQAAQRERLVHRQKGKRFFCGDDMKPSNAKIGKKPHPKAATFEHWYDKLHDERGQHSGEYVNVASCWTCNNTRNLERQREIPKHILHAQAQRHPSKQELRA